ncbi:hypothetical protein IH779_00715 [Patescibacteria group bacterium]|nr:hypothetical protein [Patescibacteria group bacterium]
MSFLKKIQNQPEGTRKIFLWIIIIILGFTFLFVWVQSLRQRLKGTQEQSVWKELRPPQFEEKIKNLPKIEVPEFPEISEEELKALEEELKILEEEAVKVKETQDE